MTRYYLRRYAKTGGVVVGRVRPARHGGVRITTWEIATIGL